MKLKDKFRNKESAMVFILDILLKGIGYTVAILFTIFVLYFFIPFVIALLVGATATALIVIGAFELDEHNKRIYPRVMLLSGIAIIICMFLYMCYLPMTNDEIQRAKERCDNTFTSKYENIWYKYAYDICRSAIPISPSK